MRTGIFRQGYGLPSQGLQLRGSDHLVNGLIAFAVFPDGIAREGATGNVSLHSTIDISPYPYKVQWQPGGSGGQGVGAIPLPQSSPWGVSAGFGASADEWLLYFATDRFITNFPTGAAARTLSTLLRRTSDSTEYIQTYGGDIHNHGGGEFFGVNYNSSVGGLGIQLEDLAGTFITVPWAYDTNWHLISLVVPPGAAIITDILFYIDGMNVPYTGSPNSTPINTFTSLGRNDWAYAVGNSNLNFAGGAANTTEFHGYIAGAWVWNRALSAAEQNIHWADPFRMIARPRSLTTIAVLSPPPPGVPTCSIISSPGTITPGGSSTLSWTTTNTPDTATIDNGVGSVNPAGGSTTVSPLVTTTYILTVTNVSGTSICTATVIVQITPPPPGPLAGQCNNPPVGKVGVPYSVTFTATGGTPPYTYAITTGALPFGLTLASNGVVSGTPTASGIFFFTVTATDSNGVKIAFNCNIPIAC